MQHTFYYIEKDIVDIKKKYESEGKGMEAQINFFERKRWKEFIEKDDDLREKKILCGTSRLFILLIDQLPYLSYYIIW